MKRKHEMHIMHDMQVSLILNITTTGRIDQPIAVEVEALPSNPYDDVWNNQPWCGQRKKTKQQVIDDLPIVTCEVAAD